MKKTVIAMVVLVAMVFASCARGPSSTNQSIEMGTASPPESSVPSSSPSNETPVSYGNTSGNISNRGTATRQGEWIYYTASGYDIYAIKTDGTERKIIADVFDGDGDFKGEQIAFLNVIDEWIYFTSSEWFDEPLSHFVSRIYAIKTDGTGYRKVADDGVIQINVVDDWIYYVNNEDRKIYAMKTDGTDRRKINDEHSSDMVVDGQWIYYLNDKNHICAIKMDGTGRKTINSDLSRGINIVGDWIYYLASFPDSNDLYGNYKIYAIKTDGSERQLVLEDGWIGSLNVSMDWIYYTRDLYGDGDTATFSLMHAVKTDGSEKRTLADGVELYTGALNIVDDWIFCVSAEEPSKNLKEYYFIKTDGTRQLPIFN